MSNKWQSKLSALLHDPLTKAFDISAHEDHAENLIEMLGLSKERGREDHVASAMDRFPLPFERGSTNNQIQVSWEETRLVHPFSGKELTELKAQLKPDDNAIINALNELKNKNNNYEKLYHAVWWNLPWLMEGAQFLPADTRISNHSIVDHLDVTAALKGCLINEGKVEASLIVVSIGPVQDLIKQARKTRDLWAGSYLLSYLIYAAIEKVGLEYGFDSVIYPYLRGIPFVQKTLQGKDVHLGEYYPLPTMSERVASLPNIFVAIVPTNEANDVIEKCKEAIKRRWKVLSEKARSEIMKKLRSRAVEEFNEKAFEEQLELFPSINAVSYPLISHDDVVDTMSNHFVGSGAKSLKEALETIKKHGGFNINAGAYYRYSYRILMSKLAAMKNIRYFPAYEGAEGVGIGNADDFGAGVKACVVFKEEDEENKEKRDLLGALNAVKRVMPDVLNVEKYESTTDIAWKNEANENNKLKNAYFAVLLMDGDKMGKWVSGDNAPEFEKLVHKKVKEAFESNDELKQAWNTLAKLKSLQPAYHKGLSRTLGIFSSLVEKVVEKYKGMLIYCGGDDVLALLPGDKALECANDLRKLYSGTGFELKCADNDEVVYKAKNGVLWKNDTPIAPVMGEKATMSAGIAVVNHKFPLQVALQMARDAEKYAKEQLGRNAFALQVVRRSGQITRVGAKWDYMDMDIPQTVTNLINDMASLKISSRSLYKLLSPDLSLFEDNIDQFVDYVIKRSTPSSKNEETKEKIDNYKKQLIGFIKAVYETYKAAHKNNKTSDNSYALKAPIDLLLSVRLMKRGVEK